MSDCIFCKISNNELPSYKVYDKEGYLGFLDINPNTKGTAIIIPKKHVSSSLIDIDYDTFNQTMVIAKKVSEHLCEKLEVEKVGLAIEGTGVNHFHVKLYPFYYDKNLTKKELKEQFENQDRVFNKYYQGYLTTQLGPAAKTDELKKLAQELFLYC